MAEWNPWNNMDALRREIDRAFESVGFRSEPFFRTAFLPGQAARRYPLINLHEDRDALYVEALAPGINPDSLELSITRNVLTVAGEKRRLPVDVKPEALHRSERAAGRFVRTVELPVEVNTNQVQARYTNGLLVITLPKSEEVRPKQISVNVT
jgi:HSP20 family protein